MTKTTYNQMFAAAAARANMTIDPGTFDRARADIGHCSAAIEFGDDGYITWDVAGMRTHGRAKVGGRASEGQIYAALRYAYEAARRGLEQEIASLSAHLHSGHIVDDLP